MSDHADKKSVEPPPPPPQPKKRKKRLEELADAGNARKNRAMKPRQASLDGDKEHDG